LTGAAESTPPDPELDCGFLLLKEQKEKKRKKEKNEKKKGRKKRERGKIGWKRRSPIHISGYATIPGTQSTIILQCHVNESHSDLFNCLLFKSYITKTNKKDKKAESICDYYTIPIYHIPKKMKNCSFTRNKQ